MVVVAGEAVVVFMATAIEAWSRARLEDVRCILKFLGCQFKATQAVKECKSYRTAKHKHKEIEDEFACVNAM